MDFFLGVLLGAGLVVSFCGALLGITKILRNTAKEWIAGTLIASYFILVFTATTIYITKILGA